ncbi:YtxH domain-containing protein [Solitalea koreensis]|uniref:YtxH-like protein n=1 Tax=Solitalea koreensis TaxID=543615 RepID=A0A521BXY6_9SPHI|nr:YtxH domain-containing protein [Solitalea koreensis]SMO52036.1 YtxH-like protein [Solitalea koreensis]
MNDNSKTMLALLAGVAVGAALGILLAPEKGTDLREKLGDNLKKTGDDLLGKLNSTIETAKSKLASRVNQASEELGI